jgi:hypothetical protein
MNQTLYLQAFMKIKYFQGTNKVQNIKKGSCYAPLIVEWINSYFKSRTARTQFALLL